MSISTKEIRGPSIVQSSLATSSESKGAKFTEHDLKQELIKEEIHCESPLEVTTKASQLDVLDRLAPWNHKKNNQ